MDAVVRAAAKLAVAKAGDAIVEPAPKARVDAIGQILAAKVAEGAQTHAMDATGLTLVMVVADLMRRMAPVALAATAAQPQALVEETPVADLEEMVRVGPTRVAAPVATKDESAGTKLRNPHLGLSVLAGGVLPNTVLLVQLSASVWTNKTRRRSSALTNNVSSKSARRDAIKPHRSTKAFANRLAKQSIAARCQRRRTGRASVLR